MAVSVKTVLIFSNLDNLLIFHPNLIKFAWSVFQDLTSQVQSNFNGSNIFGIMEICSGHG